MIELWFGLLSLLVGLVWGLFGVMMRIVIVVVVVEGPCLSCPSQSQSSMLQEGALECYEDGVILSHLGWPICWMFVVACHLQALVHG